MASVGSSDISTVTLFQFIRSEGPMTTFVFALIVFIWVFILFNPTIASIERKDDLRKQKEFFPESGAKPVIPEQIFGTFEVPLNNAGTPSTIDGAINNKFTIIDGESGSQGISSKPQAGGSGLLAALSNTFFSSVEDFTDTATVPTQGLFALGTSFVDSQGRTVVSETKEYEVKSETIFTSGCDSASFGEDRLVRFLCERNVKNGSWYKLESDFFWKNEAAGFESRDLAKECIQKLVKESFIFDEAKTKEFANSFSITKGIYYYWRQVANSFNRGGGKWVRNLYVADVNGKREYWYLDLGNATCNSEANQNQLGPPPSVKFQPCSSDQDCYGKFDQCCSDGCGDICVEDA